MLESMIWQYRTRTGPYRVSRVNKMAAETALRETLLAWRESLVAGSDLNRTALERSHHRSVYKHGQYTSVSAAARGDDFYSPAKPATYIELRLLPELAFYHNRIPTTSTARVVLTMGTFACAAAGAVLARVQLSYIVPIITSFSGGLTAWMEFRDLERKLERYSDAARSLRSLMTWWDSLSEVEQASPTNVAQLVTSGEGILRGEFGAWTTKLPDSGGDGPIESGDGKANGKEEGKEDKEDDEKERKSRESVLMSSKV